MDTIIEAIKEDRQKLISRKDIDHRIAYRIEDYLREAENNLQAAKQYMKDHDIEL